MMGPLSIHHPPRCSPQLAIKIVVVVVVVTAKQNHFLFFAAFFFLAFGWLLVGFWLGLPLIESGASR